MYRSPDEPTPNSCSWTLCRPNGPPFYNLDDGQGGRWPFIHGMWGTPDVLAELARPFLEGPAAGRPARPAGATTSRPLLAPPAGLDDNQRSAQTMRPISTNTIEGLADKPAC